MPTCRCNPPGEAVQRTHYGRVYYVCAKPQGDGTKCLFFRWGDSAPLSAGALTEEYTINGRAARAKMASGSSTKRDESVDLDFKEGDVVWVGIKSLPWWPAVIVPREFLGLGEEDGKLILPPSTKYNRVVQFFHDNNRCCVIELCHLKPYPDSHALDRPFLSIEALKKRGLLEELEDEEYSEWKDDILRACEEANAYIWRRTTKKRIPPPPTEETDATNAEPPAKKKRRTKGKRSLTIVEDKIDGMRTAVSGEIAQLKITIEAMRTAALAKNETTDELQRLQDELRRSQDDVRRERENLQSAQHELHSARDELQSARDELQRVREILHYTHDELRHAKGDLQMCRDGLQRGRENVLTLHQQRDTLRNEIRAMTAPQEIAVFGDPQDLELYEHASDDGEQDEELPEEVLASIVQ